MLPEQTAFGDSRRVGLLAWSAGRPSNYIAWSLLLVAALVLSACAVSPPTANGWAIVAADPATGDVGVAGASCSETPVDRHAFLVPDKGAGVLVGVNSTLLRDRARAWIEAPLDAATIVRRISEPGQAPATDKRSFAVVTIQNGSARAATSTGSALSPITGGATGASGTVAMLAGSMVSEKSFSQMMDAYESALPALTLSDRLLLALQTGSSAGGVALCNQNGVQQTASTAFLMLARHGDPKFEVKKLGNSAPQEPEPPYLALSVTEPIGGRNAVRILTEQYAAWRAQNLPLCGGCVRGIGNFTEGGTRTLPADTDLKVIALWLVAGFIVIVIAVTLFVLTYQPREGRSRRSRTPTA